jgi:hypothetical protein
MNIVEAIAAKEEAAQLQRVANAGFGTPPGQTHNDIAEFEKQFGPAHETSPGSQKWVTRTGAYYLLDSTGAIGTRFFPTPVLDMDRLLNIVLYRRCRVRFAQTAWHTLNNSCRRMPLVVVPTLMSGAFRGTQRELGIPPFTAGAFGRRLYLQPTLNHLAFMVVHGPECSGSPVSRTTNAFARG